MTSNLILVGVLNAVFIGYLVFLRGGQYELIGAAIAAVAVGSTIGLVVGNWLEENEYTMGN